MASKKYLPVVVGSILVLLLVIFVASHLGGSGSDAQTEAKAQVSKGLSYLEGLEAKDPAQVDTLLKQQRQQKLLELREERLSQLESGEISVWSLFEDYVLLGDSRAVGFSFYGFLPEDRVLAETGARIEAINDNMSSIIALNPSNIFVCYGTNDIGYWYSVDDFIAEVTTIFEQLHTALPDAKIYVSSILLVKDPAYSSSVGWLTLPDYNSALNTLCQSLPYCYYVDNDAICQEYTDLWEPDGVHVNRDFYPHWAANLITEVYSSGLEEQYGLTDTPDSVSSTVES